MSTADLLFELGTEELPSGEIVGIVESLCANLTEGLQSKGLCFGETRLFATPRRLAILIKDVSLLGPNSEKKYWARH